MRQVSANNKKITRSTPSAWGQMWRLGLLIVFIGISGWAIWEEANLDAVQQKRLLVQTYPKDAEVKLGLLELAVGKGDVKVADTLISQLTVNTTTRQLAQKENNERILGSNTSKLEELIKIRESMSSEKIASLIEKWEDLKKKLQGFRDVYLQLATLYARTRDNITSHEYLKIAEELDPNSEKVATVKSLINNMGNVK